MGISDKTNWEILKAFWVTTESKNLSEASSKLNIAQRTLKSQMALLEEHVGTELFTRSSKNYMSTTLTPEGERFKGKISHVRSVLYGTRNVPKYENKKEEEPLLIYTTQGLASSLLPQMMDIFFEKYPNINTIVKITSSPRKIQKGEIEIRGNFWPQSHLSKIHLIDLELSFYASKKYIQKNGNPEKFSDLENHNVLFSISSLDATYNFEGRSYIRPLLLSDDFRLSLSLCKKGHGIFVIPDFLAKDTNLTKVLKKETIPNEAVYISFINNEIDGTPAEKFISSQKKISFKNIKI